MSEMRLLEIDTIRLDGGTQLREELNRNRVSSYRDDLDAGMEDRFPPVDVFDVEGVYYLAGGFHRVAAWKASGLAKIPANVHVGTLRDAILFAVSENANHGLRRTNEEKRRAVLRLLEDAEWAKWHDREIARACRVSHTYVGNLRLEIGGGNVAGVKYELVPPPGEKEVDISPVAAGLPKKNFSKSNGFQESPDYENETQESPDDDANSEKQTESVASEQETGAPHGKTMVDGVLSDDPPDIAKLRVAGRIGPDVVPEVESNGVVAVVEEPTNAIDQDDDYFLEDGEWLATLPAWEKLSGHQLAAFESDALVYRTLEPQRKTFAFHAVRATKGKKGWYAYLVNRFLKIDHPRHWLICPSTENGGCAGTGSDPLTGECAKCRGRGYWLR